MAKKETLGCDPEGRYRRSIGWKMVGGKQVQHLFRLGKDEEEAKTANMRLEQLWDAVVARHKRLLRESRAETAEPLWDDVTLVIGQAIAKGQDACAISPPTTIASLTAELQVAWLARLQADFPIVPLRLDRPDVYLDGVGGMRQIIEVKQEMLATLKEPASTQTLHQALDAYRDYVGERYADKPSKRPQQMSIALLKQHAEDHLLDKLDADRIETWQAYWYRRPASKNSGRALALTTCRNTLIVMRQFLRWLSRSQAFAWTLPAAFTFPRCKIAKLAPDRVKKRRHFKLAELKLIWQYAKPWDRAMILLALNCGFSKREIATLQPGEIVKRSKHTFVKRHRTKTDVYGEWVLWPETLAGLAYLKQFRKPGGTYVVANRVGKPLTNGTPGGNENQVIKNHWDKLFERIRKDHPDAYKLPFKHLRKTGAQLIRNLGVDNAAELASMYLAHGEKRDGDDQLLHAYTDRPWKKLHKVLLRVRKKLLPVIQSVEHPWEVENTRVSPAKREKIKTLRAEGKTLQEIGQVVELHWTTVGKLCRE